MTNKPSKHKKNISERSGIKLTISNRVKRIYLDHAATTPLDSDVLASMLPYFNEVGNPSSLHTSGRNANQAIDDARECVADCIGAFKDEIIFTGSGTESDNLAILGTARANKDYGKHIIVSAIEHRAVLESTEILSKEGFEISVVPVDKFGIIDVKSVMSMIREDTILVSIMLGNNEIGTIQPISKLSKAIKKYRLQSLLPYIHTDVCQAVGYLPINVQDLGVDLLTLNGSKIYGPKGVGLLYKKREMKIHPVIVGGDQENGFRAGTESVPLIIGIATALKQMEVSRKDETRRIKKLREYFVSQLSKHIPDIIINGHDTKVLPHIIHVTVPKIEGESIVLMLDDVGIEVTTGSACSSRNLQPSHVLLATGQSPELIHGSVRFSLGRGTKKKDLDIVITEFSKIVQTLKNISALTSNHYEKEEKRRKQSV